MAIAFGAILLAALQPCAAQAPGADPGAATQRDLQLQEATLTARESTPQARDEAARRLASRSNRDADDILVRVLRDFSNRPGQLAVARALAVTPNADARFIDPLITLLGVDRELTAAAAQGLVAYKNNDRVRDRLIQFVSNVSQQSGPRIATIRAMGKLVDKRAAGALIELLNRDEDLAIREAAAESLVEMTGLSGYGQDVQQWNRWWDDNQNKPDPEWSSDLLNKIAARAFTLERRLVSVRDEHLKLVREDYQRTVPEERPRKLLRYLQSPLEDARWVAVQIVYEELTRARIAPEIFEALRKLVGDSSPEVRMSAARTLGAANDPGALDALLTQLSQENDADVRREILAALGPSQDTRAVEPLLRGLDDPSFSVARAAADALRDKAEVLRLETSQSTAAQVAGRLRQRIEATAGNPSARLLRRSLVEAAAKLGHPSSVDTLKLLAASERESSDVRSASLRGLGLIGNPESVDVIVSVLRNPDREVRLAAVEALRTTGSFANANKLGELLSPQVERDSTVRERAWEVLLTLFDKGPVNAVQAWVGRFSGEAEPDVRRRLAIFEIIEKKQEAAGLERDLAFTRQSIGGCLLLLDRFDDATPKFKQALDYWTSINEVPAVTDFLMQQLMRSQLRSGKFVDARTFASEIIQRNSQNTDLLWPEIKREFDRLCKANELDRANQLIEEVRRIPLGAAYASLIPQMEERLKDLRRRGSAGGRTWVHRSQRYEHAALSGRLAV